jgi:nucleotide-binding universal stress UspA family protein
MTPIRLLIAYDGSEAAADATRTAGGLFPGAQAVVVYRRGEPIELERAALARMALPDSVIAASVAEYERAAAEAAREVAERGRAIAAEAGLHATAAVQAGASPWRAICDAAAEHGAALVVCGSRGLGGFSRTLLGSTSSSLVHHAPLPVLVVPTGSGEPAGPAVIGYDGSDGAKEAIGTAARLLAGREALVVHAWSSPVERSFVGSSLLAMPIGELQEVVGDLDELFAAAARDVADEGAELAREQGLESRAVTVEAAPGTWRALAGVAAKEGAALIVAGSRGRGAAVSTVLGSVSSGLVHNASVPVLIVRGAPR